MSRIAVPPHLVTGQPMIDRPVRLMAGTLLAMLVVYLGLVFRRSVWRRWTRAYRVWRVYSSYAFPPRSSRSARLEAILDYIEASRIRLAAFQEDQNQILNFLPPMNILCVTREVDTVLLIGFIGMYFLLLIQCISAYLIAGNLHRLTDWAARRHLEWSLAVLASSAWSLIGLGEATRWLAEVPVPRSEARYEALAVSIIQEIKACGDERDRTEEEIRAEEEAERLDEEAAELAETPHQLHGLGFKFLWMRRLPVESEEGGLHF